MTRTYNYIVGISGDSDPGASEPFVIKNTSFLNSSSGDQFICQDPTLGAQVWNQSQQYISIGSWTPVLAGTVTAGTGTYTNQVGSYANTGSLIIAWFNLAWSSTTGTGNTKITGLPATASASVGVTFNPAWTVFSLPAASLFLQASISGTEINFSTIILSAVATPLALPASGSISGSFIYPI